MGPLEAPTHSFGPHFSGQLQMVQGGDRFGASLSLRTPVSPHHCSGGLSQQGSGPNSMAPWP